jgi:hypothetical protein
MQIYVGAAKFGQFERNSVIDKDSWKLGIRCENPVWRFYLHPSRSPLLCYVSTRRPGRPGHCGLIFGKEKITDRLWGVHVFVFSRVRKLFPQRWSGRSVQLISQPHVMLKIRIRGAYCCFSVGLHSEYRHNFTAYIFRPLLVDCATQQPA